MKTIVSASSTNLGREEECKARGFEVFDKTYSKKKKLLNRLDIALMNVLESSDGVLLEGIRIVHLTRITKNHNKEIRSKAEQSKESRGAVGRK